MNSGEILKKKKYELNNQDTLYSIPYSNFDQGYGIIAQGSDVTHMSPFCNVWIYDHMAKAADANQINLFQE